MNDKVIWAFPFLLKGVIATTTIFGAMKWTLINTIEICEGKWLNCGFLEISDVLYDPQVTHAPVAPDPSLLILLSLAMKHDLHIK